MRKFNLKNLGPIESWPYRVSLQRISKHFYNDESRQYEFYPLSPKIVAKGFTDTNLLIRYNEYFSENDLWINLPDMTAFNALNPHLVDVERRRIHDAHGTIEDHEEILKSLAATDIRDELPLNENDHSIFIGFLNLRAEVRGASNNIIRCETEGSMLHEDYQSVDLDRLIHYRERLFAYFFGVQLQLTSSNELSFFLGMNLFVEFSAHLPTFEYFLKAELLNASEYNGLITSSRKEQVFAYLDFVRNYEGYKLNEPFKIHVVENAQIKTIIDSFLKNFLPFQHGGVIRLLFDGSKLDDQLLVFSGRGSNLVAILIKMHELGIFKSSNIKESVINNFAYYDARVKKISVITDSAFRNAKMRGHTIDSEDATWVALTTYERRRNR